jgi:hypothetical protein
MFREPFEEPDQEDSISSPEDERDALIKERDLFKKIAHDLYMTMARIDMPRQYREKSIPAMNSYLEAFNGTQ